MQIDRFCLPLRLLIQVDQSDLHVVFVDQSRVAEVVEALAGMLFVATFGDQDLPWWVRACEEKIDGAPNGVGMGGGQLVLAGKEVRLEHDLIGNLGDQIVAHQVHRVKDVVPTAAAVCEANSTSVHR